MKRNLIMLVDDSFNDALLAQEAVSLANLQVELRHVESGQACLGELKNADHPRPDLVLLDLNMPGVNGFEVLKALRDDPELRPLPVVVLTSSDAPDDVAQAYELGCRSYISKPVDFDRFIRVLERLYHYWFGTVVLPG
ncbi:MAG: response regulator [Vulcanimicrobiota bacterium]